MVIAIITYSRLDLFLPKKALEHEIVSFMSRSERLWMNNTSIDYYKKLRPETRASNNPAAPRSNGTGTAYISLRPLFGENQEQMANTKAILKSLLTVLYARQPFVTNEIKKGAYPDAESLFAELIDAIIQAGTNVALASGNNQGVMTEDQFVRLQLGPLQSVFVNVINGCSCAKDLPNNDLQDDDDEDESESSEGIVPRYYCSLFSFANLGIYKPLSIYLTAEEVLMALYGNLSIVDEIIKVRTAAHKEYQKNKSPEAKAALERFKTVPAVIDSKYLDYNVSTTTPNRKRI